MAQRLLITELARIQAAHGVLSILPNTLLHNIFEGLNWERPFRANATLANEELAHLDKHRFRWRGYQVDDKKSLPHAARRRASRRRSRREVTKESAEGTATIVPIAERIARQQAATGRREQPNHAVTERDASAQRTRTGP